jgi:hypothetical protein
MLKHELPLKISQTKVKQINKNGYSQERYDPLTMFKLVFHVAAADC